MADRRLKPREEMFLKVIRNVDEVDNLTIGDTDTGMRRGKTSVSRGAPCKEGEWV